MPGWLEGPERFEALHWLEGAGLCLLRTGTCTAGPVPLPVQQSSIASAGGTVLVSGGSVGWSQPGRGAAAPGWMSRSPAAQGSRGSRKWSW